MHNQDMQIHHRVKGLDLAVVVVLVEEGDDTISQIEGFDQCKRYNFLWDALENNLKITRCHMMHNDTFAARRGMQAIKQSIGNIRDESAVDGETVDQLNSFLDQANEMFGRGEIKSAKEIMEQAESVTYDERMYQVMNCVIESPELEERVRVWEDGR